MDYKTARALHQINCTSQGCIRVSNNIIKATSENSENGVGIGPKEKYDIFNDILDLKTKIQMMETLWANITVTEEEDQKPEQPIKTTRDLPHVLAVK